MARRKWGHSETVDSAPSASSKLQAKKPPTLSKLLKRVDKFLNGRPVAFVLAGHNGSGKSTLWKDKMGNRVRIPLINADRLLLSILPEVEPGMALADWAQRLRDEHAGWQYVGQQGVQKFLQLAIDQKLDFAFETVFSQWIERDDGTTSSKIDLILNLQKSGYYVVLVFVGLVNAQMSIVRVATRKRDFGGHDVPEDKLHERFPRTQKAIQAAAPIADMTWMFDNSRSSKDAFTLVRAQAKEKVLFDCRDPAYLIDQQFLTVAKAWLDCVAPKL